MTLSIHDFIYLQIHRKAKVSEVSLGHGDSPCSSFVFVCSLLVLLFFLLFCYYFYFCFCFCFFFCCYVFITESNSPTAFDRAANTNTKTLPRHSTAQRTSNRRRHHTQGTLRNVSPRTQSSLSFPVLTAS